MNDVIDQQRTQQALTGQQMSSLVKQYNDELVRIKKDVELRKLALDQACNCVTATNAEPKGGVTFHDPIALAKAMHAFLVEGAKAEGATEQK